MDQGYKPKRSDLGQFKATFRGSAQSLIGLAIVLVVVVVISLVIGLFRGGSLENIIKSAPAITLTMLGLYGVFYLLIKFHSVSAYSKGLEGKNYWSWTVRFHWNQIESMYFQSSNGLDAAVLTQKKNGKGDVDTPRSLFEPRISSSGGALFRF